MSRVSPDLRTPPSTPEGETWVYQLGLPFQVDQDTAASFCNIRVSGVKGTDFENGSDVILFKDLSKVSAEGAIPITRNNNEPNPNSKPPNQERIVKLSRNLEFWRRNRSTLGCRINNLESGEGAE